MRRVRSGAGTKVGDLPGLAGHFTRGGDGIVGCGKCIGSFVGAEALIVDLVGDSGGALKFGTRTNARHCSRENCP
jgi:hypothetical protein